MYLNEEFYEAFNKYQTLFSLCFLWNPIISNLIGVHYQILFIWYLVKKLPYGVSLGTHLYDKTRAL